MISLKRGVTFLPSTCAGGKPRSEAQKNQLKMKKSKKKARQIYRAKTTN